MKTLFATSLLLAALSMTACQDDLNIVDGLSDKTTTKQFNFTVKGSFTDTWKPVTRGMLATNEEEITDLWVLDYQNGALLQQMHQSSTDHNFGNPSLNLTLGNHHIYFIASSGTSPILSISDHNIIWEKVNDTFYRDLSITVEATSNGNRIVTLDRSVTKLKLTIADAVQVGTTAFLVVPHNWYYGIDFFTGRPTASKIDKTIFIDCDPSSIGKTNTEVSIFGFSSTTEWINDVTLYASDGTYVLAKANIKNAPFKRNRTTEYSGSLFDSDGLVDFTFTFNNAWEEPETGSW